MSPIFQDTIIAMHGGQKYGEEPYAYHLTGVARMVKAYGDIHAAVALAHDVLEDTQAGAHKVAQAFGALFKDDPAAVMTAMRALHDITKKQGEDYYEYISRLSDPIALIVKRADLKFNLAHSYMDVMVHPKATLYKFALDVINTKIKHLEHDPS